MSQPRRALVTGVTGYIGSRLVPRLVDEGWQVRVLTRDEAKVAERWWRPEVEVVEGDATSRDVLREALEGVDVAYYLLHSMDGEGGFVERDRELARTFGVAAFEAEVGRIVYLSGLHPDDGPLSDHLASRVEVGDLLMASGVPTAVLQAAVILGSGSASFEMLRHLTTRLPVMVTPKWLDNRIQPIAIRDVLHLLVGAADLPPDVNRTFDIGGPDVLTYREMITRFARIAGLRPRGIVTVPVLTPHLASQWVGLVTPVPTGVAKPLVGSLLHEVVRTEHDLEGYVGEPEGGALSFDRAVADAIAGDGADPRPEPGTVDPARVTAADPAWAGGGS
ncbi:NAD(P)H-binding protein [Oryzobacter sp. R7]|uniref:NAD(P)H-binding protein n=1 Tax=Oryzobacter faecalis TaxID=3388656 RepID=UPI00398CFF6C